MPLTSQSSRAARLAIAISLALLIGAASCKNGGEASKNPSEKPNTTATKTSTSASDKLDVPPKTKIEVKEVQDVGPKAPAIYMLSGLKGYTEPCGCTADILLGGIDRIAGYIEAAKALHPSMVILDGGNLWFEEPEIAEVRVAQEKLKAQTVAKAYGKLGVRAGVPGPNDFALGVEVYAELMKAASLSPHGVNIKVEGVEVKPGFVQELDGIKVGVIPAVEPALFEGVKGVTTTPAKDAVAKSLATLKAQGASTFFLLFHGKLAAAKDLLEAFPQIDFVQVGAKPRETDQVDKVGEGGFTLEPYDQGRYIGVLKLYKPATPGPKDPVYTNAKPSSQTEQEKIDRQIDHVHQSIKKLPPAAPGEESGMLKSLRARIKRLEERKAQMEANSIDVPKDAWAFVYRPVAVDPGYKVDPKVESWRKSLNKEIKKANAAIDFKVPPVEKGQAFYVGNTQCQSCHADAYTFWSKTNHGHALETLVQRDKDYDQACVGCHVVGYEKPGGSVLGKLQYKAKLGEAGIEIEKDLRHVGCENCHGPGSTHVEAAMFGKLGSPKDHIKLEAPQETCMQCHVKEHSPKFNYDVYIKQIVGPGHGMPVEAKKTGK